MKELFKPVQGEISEDPRFLPVCGALALILFLWIVIYNLGKPWDCRQAKQMVAEAKLSQDREISRAMSGKIPHPDIAIVDAASAVDKAELKESRMCH